MSKVKRTRRKFSNEFKTKVCLEAIKERQTLSELAEKHNIHPGVISNWKTEFLQGAVHAFSGTKVKSEETSSDELNIRIGQLEMENQFLKKSLTKLGQ